MEKMDRELGREKEKERELYKNLKSLLVKFLLFTRI